MKVQSNLCVKYHKMECANYSFGHTLSVNADLNESNISSNMWLQCWTKYWIRLNAPISSNISYKKKKTILNGAGWNFFLNKFFIQHFLASITKIICWIGLKWFTIQHLISNTISNVDFNVFKHSNVYSNVFIENNKGWSYSFFSQYQHHEQCWRRSKSCKGACL